MKKNLFFAGIILSLFLNSGCKQTVEYVDKVVSNVTTSFEDSGTKVSESEYFKNGKKTSDWLMVMYMDADNNLEYSIRTDFNEVEYGLSFIRNTDGSAKDGFVNVRVVVLWDGRQTADTRIFELGPDSSNSLPGNNSYNITGVSFITENNNEVDMSKPETITSLLDWVNSHYDATHTIFHVGDHGNGPGPDTRAMISDSTAGTAVMSSSDFGTALWNAGYGQVTSPKKLDGIFLDVCLGASIEDAYEFNLYADYMVASPDLTPGPGFDYVGVMKSFLTSNNTPELIFKAIGQSFAEAYKDFNYSSLKTYKWYDTGIDSANKINLTLTDDKVNYYIGFDYYNSYGSRTYNNSQLPTVSVINLSEIDECADAIDALSASIKDYRSNYIVYLVNVLGASYKNSLYYPGSVNWLFDIGYFADQVEKKSEELGHSAIKTNAAALKTKLSEAIVYSWRAGRFDEQDVNLYEKVGLTCCGLTICGGMRYGQYTWGIPSWYAKTAESNSSMLWGNRENGWAVMLKQWFGTAQTAVYNSFTQEFSLPN